MPDLCRSSCCSECASRPGLRLAKFGRRLRNGGPVSVMLAGNSVARTAAFATARTAISALQSAYPKAEFSFSYATVAGAFDPPYVYDQITSSSEQYTKYHLIIVQYSNLGQGEDLLRALVSLPQQPLVLVVEHCGLPMFDAAVLRDPIAATGMAHLHFLDGQVLHDLVRRWNLPLVSACSAVTWVSAAGVIKTHVPRDAPA